MTLKIEHGRVYFVSASRKKAFDILKDKIQHYIPIVHSRTNPKHLIEDFNLPISEEKINWIKHAEKGFGLEHIFLNIKQECESDEQGQILIDGVDYLIQKFSFDNVYNFINKIYDIIAKKEYFAIFPLEPKTVDKKEYELLRSRHKVI